MSDDLYPAEKVQWFAEHASNQTIRRLARTAMRAMEEAEDARRARCDADWRAAEGRPLRVDHILVLLHRDGLVEVWGRDWLPVRFAHVPDLADYQSGVEWACRSLPACYSDLVVKDAGKCLWSDSTAAVPTAFAATRIERRQREAAIVQQLCRCLVARGPVAEVIEQ